MPLVRRRAPFSHTEWFFEIKWDGFRSLAKIENGRCKLISRNGNQFKSLPELTARFPVKFDFKEFVWQLLWSTDRPL